MNLGLNAKVVLVTGASKGLGRAIAEEFAKEGAHVSICARGNDDLQRTAAELRRFGLNVVAVQADATVTADVQRVIDETVRQLGRIDVLVNNAGEATLSMTVAATDEEWQACMETNLLSAVRFTRAVVPHMRRQGGGRIINISTSSGRTPVGGMPGYNTAKAAMLAFSKSMSFELAADRILVNCVAPACIHSPLWERLADSFIPAMGNTRSEVYQNLANQNITLKRFGTDDEVSGLVAFLASERASFMTGSVYDVDGGIQKSL